MRRMITLASLSATLAAAFALYAVKYDTRALERQARKVERRIEHAERDIIVLQAERAHLMRPERIEALARANGMRPAAPDQFGSIEDLPLRAQALPALPALPASPASPGPGISIGDLINGR